MSTTSPKPASFSKWFLRLTLWLLLAVAGAAVILPAAAVFLFDPNDFKPQISAYFQEKTGIAVQLDKINLKLFPNIGLSVDNLTMPQPSGYGGGDFLKVREVTLQVPLKELMRKHLKIEQINIDGVELDLIRDLKGGANWKIIEEQIKAKKPKNDPSPHSATQPEESSQGNKKIRVTLKGLQLKNTKISYRDLEKGQKVVLEGLKLQTAFMIGMQAVFAGEADLNLTRMGDDKPQSLQGHALFNGRILEKGHTIVGLGLDLQLPYQEPWKKIKGGFTVDFTPDGPLTLKKIKLTANGHQLTGNVTVPAAKTAPITFTLNMNTLNVDTLPKFGTEKGPAAAQASSAKPGKPAPNTAVAPSATRLRGNLTIGELKAKNIKINDVSGKLVIEGNQLKLQPLTATVYQGKLNVAVSKPLSQGQTRLDGTLLGVDVQSLLKDLGKPEKITGTADLNFNLAQSGDNLDGVTKFHLKNGSIQGVDVKYYLSQAMALFNKEPETKAENTKATPFNDMTGTLYIHDRIVDNNDLKVSSSDFTASGDGSFNLATRGIEYKIQAMRQYSDGKEHPNAYPLALRIKGTIDHPKVAPDYDVYPKKAAERELRKQVEKQLSGKLGQKLEEKLGKYLKDKQETPAEATVPNTEGQPAPAPTPEDQLQQKLEDEINRGLKKLFKKKKDDGS